MHTVINLTYLLDVQHGLYEGLHREMGAPEFRTTIELQRLDTDGN